MFFFGRGSHDELIDFGAFAPTHHGVPTVLSPSKEGEERGKETATVQRISPWGIRRRDSPELVLSLYRQALHLCRLLVSATCVGCQCCRPIRSESSLSLITMTKHKRAHSVGDDPKAKSSRKLMTQATDNGSSTCRLQLNLAATPHVISDDSDDTAMRRDERDSDIRDKKLVVNELLFFINNHIDTTPSASLKSVIVEFYHEQEIIKAKQNLLSCFSDLKTYGLTVFAKKNRIVNKAKASVDDIFGIFKAIVREMYLIDCHCSVLLMQNGCQHYQKTGQIWLPSAMTCHV